ncbi:transcription factor e(y)2-domain-containing protein [Glomus cerebriforme]|uniref:Transcription and mRNA export factor SUS1 n=1 Tax=Glomus cerebriforme TaxID=658196 RepID=A0A397TCC7_9GLOM|nr:transcription factor e(y)2-domain-containing protein [Glomus cerebriforme]
MSESENEQKLANEFKSRFLETQDRNRLKRLLAKRLRDCGWKDKIKKRCVDKIRTEGVENIKLDQLEESILTHGREAVPDDVKVEILQQISSFLDKHISQPQLEKNLK